MESPTLRRTLVVANRTASTPELLTEVERRAAEQATEFMLLIPDASSRRAADWTLREALLSLHRAASGPHGLRRAQVDGRVAGPDAFGSIEQALAERTFDDVIISMLPARRSAWLRRGLPRRVQALGVPVTVITYDQFADVSATPISDVFVGLVALATILGGGLAAIYAIGYFLTGQASIAWPLVGTIAGLLVANIVVRTARSIMRRRL
jgi:hypothetical protein